jgi:hypothetical protein
MTGSFDASGIHNNKEVGYAHFKSTDQRVNIGVAAQYSFGMAQISYSNANGNLRGDYLQSKITGDQFSAGFSAPIALDGALRVQARYAYGDYRSKGSRVTNDGQADFSRVDGTASVFGGGFEYMKAGKTWSVDATLEVLGVRTSVAGFTETGAAALENLSVAAQRDRFAMVATNVEVGYQLSSSAVGYLTLGVDQDLESGVHAVTANVALEDAAFSVFNPGLNSTRAKAGLGARVNLGSNIIWNVEGNMGNASSYGAKTGVSFRF